MKLHARGLRSLGTTSPGPFVGRISESAGDKGACSGEELLLVKAEASALPPGYLGYLLYHPTDVGSLRDAYVLGPEQRHLQHGDVVRIDPARGGISSIYRAASRHNTLLVTERCDNLCVMCSQPPRVQDDSWLADELERAIVLIPKDAVELGITGGEPALLGARLVRILTLMRDHLPRTAVHILTNGRRFAEPAFAGAMGAIGHPDLMLGIPLYSDLPEEHDYVVQARGAFDETVRGILNLKRKRLRVELRFVIHRDTAGRLPDFARFVARNLTFLDHVALMGLEVMGFAKTNLDTLWIDPLDYQPELAEAIRTLRRANMAVSIYNHQLCTLDADLHPFARKSISDWKNCFFAECEGCARKDDCGGFFVSSSARRSRGIRPLPPGAPTR
ncbi:MAG: His-Xaa-Ser system radical SAM maturase HxsC [Polyangiaceae bacterium]